CYHMMSTPVFVDPESSSQADGAQSYRVPVPLPEYPYEAIRQAYLDGTDTESEPFEDPIDTKTPKSPLAIAPPVPLSESTLPVLVPVGNFELLLPVLLYYCWFKIDTAAKD
ncbi:hypothetical protein Tco_0279416, partial [Tanacetum coccineum]